MAKAHGPLFAGQPSVPRSGSYLQRALIRDTLAQADAILTDPQRIQHLTGEDVFALLDRIPVWVAAVAKLASTRVRQSYSTSKRGA